ncbi:MAG: hypothetical protein ACI855_004140, partial [Myxococcota bacterium]
EIGAVSKVGLSGDICDNGARSGGAEFGEIGELVWRRACGDHPARFPAEQLINKLILPPKNLRVFDLIIGVALRLRQTVEPHPAVGKKNPKLTRNKWQLAKCLGPHVIVYRHVNRLEVRPRRLPAPHS